MSANMNESNLLLDEYPLVILPSLATKIGLNEAIVLQQIHYWLVRYEKANDERHNRDGRWWVYNTAEEWQENFPFWSVSTVRRTLDSLRETGLVLTGNYNQKGYDRTLWYSIDYARLVEIDKSDAQNEQMVCSEWADDVSKMSAPIPETTTETTSQTTSSKVADATPTSFNGWLGIIRTSKNKAALLRRMFVTLYPESTAPEYSYIGRVARKVGGAARLAQMMWEQSTRPPVGDVLAYLSRVSAASRADKKEEPNGFAAVRAFMEELDGDEQGGG